MTLCGCRQLFFKVYIMLLLLVFLVRDPFLQFQAYELIASILFLYVMVPPKDFWNPERLFKEFAIELSPLS